MWARRMVVVHVGQQVRRGRRVVLCGCHLVHKIGRVDGLVVLRLAVEHVRVKRVPKLRRQRLVLAEVVGLEEVGVVGVGGVGDVEWVGRDVAALGAELRSVVLRNVLCSLEESWFGKGVLLGEWLALGRGEEVRVV